MKLTYAVSNYFKKYIQREIAKATGVTVHRPFRGWKELPFGRRQVWVYDENRPWTTAAQDFNRSRTSNKRILVEPISDENWKIFVGDRVQILTGPDKGKQGIVNCLIKERNWCYVEGLNCKYNWVNKSATTAGILSKEEKPLLVTTEVELVDPTDEKSSAIDWRFTEDGRRVRVSQRTGRVIPIPKSSDDQAYDMTIISKYKETDKDTRDKELKRVTFKPSLLTFEQDIMQRMGIVETRTRAKTYWY